MSSSPDTKSNLPRTNHKLARIIFISYLAISLLLVAGLVSILYTYSQDFLPDLNISFWFFAIAGIYLFCGVIFLFILYRKLKPLTDIILNLYLFLGGYWEYRNEIIRNDETGILASGINTISDEIVDLFVSLESQKEITSHLTKQIESISRPFLLPFLKDTLKTLQGISLVEFEIHGEKIIYQETLKLISDAGYPAYFWVYDKRKDDINPGEMKNGLLMITIPDQLTGFIKEEWTPIGNSSSNFPDPEILWNVSHTVLKSSEINDYLLNGTISVDDLSPLIEWLPDTILKWANTSTLNIIAFFHVYNQGELKGFLVIGNRLGDNDSFATYVIESFQILVEALNLVIDDLVFQKQSLSEIVEMNSTITAAISIGGSNNLPHAYEITNQIICDLFRPDYLSIFTYETQNKNLKLKYSNAESGLINSEINPIDRELTSYIMQTSEPLFILDSNSFIMNGKGISSPDLSNWVGIPIKYMNNILGTIVFQDSKREIIPDKHKIVLEYIANQLAIVIQDSRYQTSIENARKADLIAEKIMMSSDPEEMMEIALKELNQILEINESQLLIHQYGSQSPSIFFDNN